MTFADILAVVFDLLGRAGIPYMLTGSLASSYYGEPRSTRDVDIVIDPTAARLSNLVDALAAAGFYVDRAAALDALAARSQFNAILSDATKVDFIIRRERPFSIEEFGRRRPANLLGANGYVATAEDLIVAKLEWAAMSGSERQLDDVAAILAIAEEIDHDYIDRWVGSLGLKDAWQSVRADAD